jgi:hypothetical protein
MEPIHIFIIVAISNIAIAGIVGVVIYKRIQKINKKIINPHWQWLVDKLQLEIHGGEPVYPGKKWLSWMRTPLRLEGNYRNFSMKIYNYTVGSGKNSTTYSTARIIGPNPKNLTFEFHREGMFSKLGKLVGMEDIQSGDKEFDKKFIIKSSNPDFIKVVLLPQIKEKFCDIWNQHKAQGTIRLKDEELQYNEVGTIRNEATCERFAAIADLLVDLRGTIEFYNKK